MTLLLLIANPMAYNKLKAEIDDAIAKGNISSPIKDAESDSYRTYKPSSKKVFVHSPS